MRASALTGVRAKFDWAKKHAEDIAAAINKCLGTQAKVNQKRVPPFEFDDERHLLIVRSPEAEPLDPTLPLAVGDCIHNLRSALDHLVCQLAVLNGTPAIESKTAFPITLTRGEFKNFTRHKVAPFISAKALAAIEEFQPYQSPEPADQSVLWVLSQLDIIDKHRLIIVVGTQHKPVGFTVRLPGGEVLQNSIEDSIWKPLKDGTEIIRFDLSDAITAPGKVNVKLQTASAVFLTDTGLICDNKILKVTLENFFWGVDFLINEFGRRFFGE